MLIVQLQYCRVAAGYIGLGMGEDESPASSQRREAILVWKLVNVEMKRGRVSCIELAQKSLYACHEHVVRAEHGSSEYLQCLVFDFVEIFQRLRPRLLYVSFVDHIVLQKGCSPSSATSKQKAHI